jgi:hypothetical protein
MDANEALTEPFEQHRYVVADFHRIPRRILHGAISVETELARPGSQKVHRVAPPGSLEATAYASSGTNS